MTLFYTPDITGTTYQLSEEESKHAIRVLRLQVNDTVQLIDGKGGFYTAVIAAATAKRCTLHITNHITEYGKQKGYLHIAIAPTKNIERIEWFVEKATEIGINEITPLICQRSERRDIKVERIDKIAISAVKQSIKAYKPIINEAVPFTQFIKKPQDGLKGITHCETGEKHAIAQVNNQHATILIGPEGDFTPEEIELALNNGYNAITLGTARLRTETAALAAVFEFNFLNNR